MTIDSPNLRLIVYIVDDDDASRDSLVMLLQGRGYQVKSFDRPSRFLEQVTPEIYGCVVLDVRMAGIDGLEVQSRLNEASIEIPIIFVSGHADVEIATNALRSGAMDLLEKPIESDLLLARVELAFTSEQRRFFERQSMQSFQEKMKLLTSKEQEVLPHIYHGDSLKQIATAFDFTIATASRHQSRIFEKLEVESSVALVHLIKSIGYEFDQNATPQ